MASPPAGAELRIVAPFYNLSGFAKAGRALLRTALLAGYRVQAVESEINRIRTLRVDGTIVETTEPRFGGSPIPACQREELEAALVTEVAPDAPTLLLQNPSGLAGWPDYCEGPRIGVTMLESDTLTPLWATAAANVDLLLAPSLFCQETIQRDVPSVPCELLPLPVDERLWSDEGPELEIQEIPKRPGFLFLSVFSTCERKGWRKLMQAFAEEFPGEDAGLYLHCTRGAEVEEMATWCRSRGVFVQVRDARVTDEEMATLYRSCDVFALPSCEGFGLPFVEAALCGKPSVGLDHGGQADFVVGTGYDVAARLESCVGQLPQIYPSSQGWWTCGISELRASLRQAFEERDTQIGRYRARAASLRAERLTPCALAGALRSFVEQASERYRESVKPLPVAVAERRVPVCIVTTHNHLESTRRCVESIRRFSPGAAVILADDGSSDGTREWAEQDAKGSVLFLPCNTGGNVSQNRQIAMDYVRDNPGSFVKNPFLVFLDNDVEVTSGWWEDMLAVFAAEPSVGILAPRKVFGDDGRVQNIGNRLLFNAGTFPMLLERPLVSADYVESAAMAVRPEVWPSLRWDPQFPIFYEDADICLQAREAGWRVAATNRATVVHHAHTTSGARADEAEANRSKFLRKWAVKGAM
jgi:GT2 family glycosyltransferase/glycosyltransferase involved in cell wall biosynthesis